MPYTDEQWSEVLIDIVGRFGDGVITENAAALELAAATLNWPTRTLSNADLGQRLVETLARLEGLIITTDVPGPELGKVGGMALNASTGDLYGPKTESGWGDPFSLIGTVGPEGPQGPQGIEGIQGPVGPAGPANPATSYPTSAASAVPKGVVSINLTSGGTGYTNGTNFVGTFTGGGGTGAQFLFDVVGGIIENIHAIEPGYGYTSNPTPVFTASVGGTGVTATATAGFLIASGEFYWTLLSTGGERLYQNVAGVATAVTPASYRPYAPIVQTTASAVTSIIWNFAIDAGFLVNGVTQGFRAVAPGNNGVGQLKFAVAGVFSGAQTNAVLPNLEPVPTGHLKTGYRFDFYPLTISGTNYFIVTSPVAIPETPVVLLQWMGPLGYNTGTGAISAGNTLTGGTSGATAVVLSVPDAEATGTGTPPLWNGSRAGTLYVDRTAAFVAGEDLLVGGVMKAKATGPVVHSEAVSAKVALPNQKINSLLQHTEFWIEALADKKLQSPSYKLYAYDGVTVLIAATSLRGSDDVQPLTEAGLWSQGNKIKFKRHLTSGRWNLVTESDTITNNVLKTNFSLAPMGPLTSVIRPIKVLKPAKSLQIIDVFPHDDHYDSPTMRADSDYTRFGIVDMGDFQGISFSPTLNTVVGEIDTVQFQVANHLFYDLISQIITETGHVPSVNDMVAMCIKYGDPVNSTNAVLAGPGHGHETPLTYKQTGALADPSTGFITAVTRSNPLTVTIPGNNYEIGREVTFGYIPGVPQLSNQTLTVSAVAGDVVSFPVNSSTWGIFVTAATNGTSLTVTAPGHGLIVGSTPTFSGILGMTQLNGTFTVTGVAGNVLTFSGTNSSAWGVFQGQDRNVEKDTTNLQTKPLGPVFYGDRWTSEYTGLYLAGLDNKVAFHVTRKIIVESASGHTIRKTVVLDPTHGSVNTTPGLAPGGYSDMLALRGRLNKICGYIDGVPGPVQDINLRNGATVNLGNAEYVEAWHSSRPDIRVRHTNNAGGSGDGVGWSHYENTGSGWVRVPREGPVICLQAAWGCGKIYWGMYELQTASKNMTGIKVMTDFSIAILHGENPAL